MAPSISSRLLTEARSFSGTRCMRPSAQLVRSKYRSQANNMRLLTSTFLLTTVLQVSSAQTDWPIYGHDPGGRQYSPLKQINTGNVSKLRVAWTYDARPADSP